LNTKNALFLSAFYFTTISRALVKKAMNEKHKLSEIQTNAETLKQYMSKIKKITPCKLDTAIQYARTICDGLDDTDASKYENSRNKGALGNFVELAHFGIERNSTSTPDLPCGIDIKTTHFKKMKNGMYNAAERISVTHCGCTKDYSTFHDITNKEVLSECKHYSKLRKGALFIFEKGTYETLKDAVLLDVLIYDLEELPEDVKTVIHEDYKRIRQRIQEKTVSERGQMYLHIHTKGKNKNSETRGLGFKPKFVTKLVSHYCDKEIVVKGRSHSVKF